MEKRKQEGREGEKVTEEGHRVRKEEENNRNTKSNNILSSGFFSLQPVYCQCYYNYNNKIVRTEIKTYV